MINKLHLKTINRMKMAKRVIVNGRKLRNLRNVSVYS